MDGVTNTLLTLLGSIILFLVYLGWKINQYWKERGVAHRKPLLFFGNALPTLLMRKRLGENFADICSEFPDEEIIGYYDFTRPSLLIKGVDTIERILIKDFQYFTDHGFNIDEERSPLDSSLLTMNGKRWKAMRNRISPVFTTGKLKLMFDTIIECGDILIKQLENCKEVEMRDFFGRFAIDVIGSTAFGLEPKNLEDPDHEFHKKAKGTFELTFLQLFKFIILTIFPFLNKFITVTFNKPEVTKYFSGIVRDTIKYRRENGYKRNDFLQLMIQLQDKGYVEMLTKDPDDDYLAIDKNELSTEKFELTNEQITGQALAFLTAGVDATSSTMTYTLYELSKHPEIQEKVRQEIIKAVKTTGSLSFEALKEMHYLENCIKESMRLHDVVQMLVRVCTKDYTFPNGLQIKAGQELFICVQALNSNETYYPEPKKFKPERFNPENSLPSCAFTPFGNGPRICIAMRFAMLEMKYCIAKLLMNYRFKISPKTKEPLTVNVKSFFAAPNEKVIFNITKVQD